MKHFPRIYSLSTIGLIHHQEFNYLFHPLRTDFIGESGSGKSMIADLLQLILVGSESFQSATKAIGERKPDGMVLQIGSGKSVSTGYAFLNIEISDKKYIVIGVYLETSSNHSQSFIIHSGYDLNNLTPLHEPLLFKDLLKNGDEILPIDLLKEFLDKKSLICESWQRVKAFHDVLFKNKILPIDLAVNEKVLNDYAKIIQSFSRGKSLDTQKSNSLKDFLFGKEKAQEISKKYGEAVTELEAVVGDYGRNLKEIERVTQKQKALAELKRKKLERDRHQDKWLNRSLKYWNQRESEIGDLISKLVQRYITSKSKASILYSVLNQHLSSQRKETGILADEEREALERFQEALTGHSKIRKVDGLLSKLNCSLSSLIAKYEEQQKMLANLRLLTEAKDLIENKTALDLIEEISANETYSSFILSVDERLNDFERKIAEKRALSAYADLNNKDSLGYWALQQKRIFNRFEESAIVHFQTLERRKTENKSRYLPHPQELFDKLQVVEKEQNGYWINLGGIWEYINYVKKQILDTTEPDKIRQYFNTVLSSLSKEIQQDEKLKQQYEYIKKTFDHFKNPKEVFTAVLERFTFERKAPVADLHISNEEFNSLVECYNQRHIVEEEYLVAKKKYDLAQATKINAEQFLREVLKLNEELTLIFEDKESSLTQFYVNACRSNNSQISLELQENFEGLTAGNLEKIEVIKTSFKEMKEHLTINAKIEALDNELKVAKKNKQEFINLFTLAYGSDPIMETNSERVEKEPLHEREDYLLSEQSYTLEYKKIIETFLSQDAYKFKDGNDFLELGRNLLPEAFQNESITETSVIETIDRYLRNINEKNRQLNNRKIQKIRDLLDEVDDGITTQLDVVRRIDNFFKSEEKKITGGHQVRLRKSWSQEFPKDWIDKFKIAVNEEINSAALESQLFKKLTVKVGLEEMMLEAFYSSGGSRTFSPSIQKLLDPSSYFDLSFSMETTSGRINKGSSGQTYTAIALLCIARLSIIGKDEGAEHNPGIRIMPIDEAEGLGSNYDMLYQIAKDYGYQIISLSVNPIGKFTDGEQYIYMLHKNLDEEDPINYTPMAIFSRADLGNT